MSAITAQSANDLSVFTPFSVMHGAIVLGFAAALWAETVIAGRMRPEARRRAERAAGIGFLLFWLGQGAWWIHPANFTLRASLPLHVCDLAGLLAGIALLLGPGGAGRGAAMLTWYLGIGLCTQAFITPTLQEGPADPRFWFFWGGHAIAVGTAVHLVAVSGYRPTWRDCRRAIGVGLAYMGAIFVFNLVFDVNYCYLGRSTPEHPTLIDVLGPWPWRVPVILAAGCLVFILITWPFEASNRAGRGGVEGGRAEAG